MAGLPTNMDQFEAYFKRADLDGDGRISGTEAVNFFQGANLPKQVLAQIWMHADQSRTGFLGRPDFYNALKLATVAQSKRDLTPDIVKAALYGPAASKIPPPKINFPPIPVQQVNPVAAAAASAPQMTPLHNQALGLRGPGLPNAAINQQYFPPSPQTQTMTPPQVVPPGIASHPPHGIVNPDFSRGGGTAMAHSQLMPTTPSPTPTPIATASRPPQSMPAPTTTPTIPHSNISTNWLAGKSTVALSAPLSTSNVTIHSQTQVSMPSQPSVIDSKPLVVSGNGFATGLSFGGDMFSATTSTRRQEPFVPTYSSAAPPASATMVPATSGGLSVKSISLDSLQSAYAMQPLGGQLQRTQSLPTSGQQVSTSVSSSLTSPSVSTGVGNSSDNSHPTWPKMKPSDVQKYTKVFMEVDTDRDGRITGEQARNLFLSWRLPREVLKQVWDLSDQDNDSMLSLREFCFALYLMERYREGRPLPASLPSNIMFDETLLSMTGQPKATYGNVAWGPNPGFGQQPGMGARPIGPATGLRLPVQVSPLQSQPDSVLVSNQQKPRAPVLEDSFLNQSNSGEQNSMPKDGTAAENKVESEKVILDSREKIEFYRSKMQDLVLYKSRCDNRLNEITERAMADKREAEILGKKYEEKYKQVAEVASKLTIEEATFRDIQERKFELNQAILNMEQGGSADGILQVRADRIQSDLDELLRVLIERSKKHGLEVKSAAMIELPFGWQPGIQDGAAVWDEDWDKFEDEGFANDLTIDVTKSKSTVQKEIGSQEGSLTPDSLSNGGAKSANFFSTSEHALESESAYGHSEDEQARSPRGSSTGRTALESPSQDFSDVFAKSTDADAETHSFDESTWGAFDTHDETDSVWGFNPSSTKDSDSHRDFFGTGDFGVKPIRTGSPSSDSLFQKKSPFFEDSVAGSPVSRFANSPRYSEAGDHSDNFSRLESFNMHEGRFSPRERLTRFDSINSSKDFGHSRAFSSFDDADPFGSSGPFKVSSNNQTPKKGSESWGGF